MILIQLLEGLKAYSSSLAKDVQEGIPILKNQTGDSNDAHKNDERYGIQPKSIGVESSVERVERSVKQV